MLQNTSQSVHLVPTNKCLNNLNLNLNLNPNLKILPLRLLWWLLSDSESDSRSIGFIIDSGMHARIHTCLQKSKDKTIPSRYIFMCHYMNLICLEMNGRSKRPSLWTAITSHKLHASEYETIYCKYSHSNQQIRQ